MNMNSLGLNLIDWQVRVSQEQEHFLLNPFGLLYSEVTASSLIKVDMQVSSRFSFYLFRLNSPPFDRLTIDLMLLLLTDRETWSIREQRTLE